MVNGLKILQNGEATIQLKKAGIHITSERIAVASFLIETGAPTTVKEIQQVLVKLFPGVNAQKIFSHLRIFIEAGIIHKMMYKNLPDQYELIPVSEYSLGLLSKNKQNDHTQN